MTNPIDDRSSMAAAMEWVSRITTIALEMVLPGIAGSWLDGRWGTSFLALAGFALGISVALWHLLQIAKVGARPKYRPHSDSKNDSPNRKHLDGPPRPDSPPDDQ